MIFRKALFGDTETIFHLIAVYAKNGEMLARSRNTIYENLRDLVVAEDEDGEVVGVGGLHITWDSMAEICAMAVAPEMVRQGIGSGIVNMLIEEGRELGVKTFFTLTYKPKFFESLALRWFPVMICLTRYGRIALTARSSRIVTKLP